MVQIWIHADASRPRRMPKNELGEVKTSWVSGPKAPGTIKNPSEEWDQQAVLSHIEQEQIIVDQLWKLADEQMKRSSLWY